ncbi:RidA family protein [Salinicoccus sesuvii]|uniref:RidA family protein n=1 Tax=Salinicoccus sesuvii TaxID=868281 RepID=A0ABV7N1V8_9STAP
MRFEERLANRGLQLPEYKSKKVFEPAVVTGNLVFVSGHAAKVDGSLVYNGIVGDSISLVEAQDAATICFLNCLSALKSKIGELDKISQFVNVKGYVASTPAFTDHPKVMNGVSELINEVFGETGKHSRISFGASSLPEGTPVEVEIVVEIKH